MGKLSQVAKTLMHTRRRSGQNTFDIQNTTYMSIKYYKNKKHVRFLFYFFFFLCRDEQNLN